MTLALVVTLLALLGSAPWWWPARFGRRPPRGAAAPRLDAAVLLDLGAAALHAGVAVPAALRALGAAAGGTTGQALEQAGRLLLLGAAWEEAWSVAPAETTPLADALRPAWEDGVDPGPVLAAAARTLRADRDRAAREAAARLGARLVLPLGLCFLPGFVLLGLVPVLLSTGGDLLHG